MYDVAIGNRVRVTLPEDGPLGRAYTVEGELIDWSATAPADGYKDWLSIKTKVGKFTWIPYIHGGKIEKV